MRFQLLALTTVSLAVMSSAANAIVVPNTASPEFIDQKQKVTDRPEVGGAPVIGTRDESGKEISGNVMFTLKSVKLEGVTAVSEAELKALYEDKLGQRISVSQLNGIANAITAYYRNHGYILTRAILPPQRIQSGEVKIRIVEGFVSDVIVQGDVNGSATIQAYAEKIKASKPLDAKILERYLLLMEDLPGVEARAVLQPSANTSGASQIVVNITRKPIEGSLNLDNRGSRFLGQYEGGIVVAANNIIGLDEQTQVRFTNTLGDWDELHYGEIKHEEQIGNEGTKLVLSANQVWTQPGHTLTILEIEGASTNFTAGLSHPLYRSRQSNWFVNGDFSVRRAATSSLDFNLYEDKLRVLTVGTAYDFVDGWFAINRIEANIAKGFNWWTDNGGLGLSRANGEHDFIKFTANVSRLQPLFGNFSLYGTASGQYSADPLLAAEEFAVGGQEFGSAYDLAEITGDSGLAGRLELQYNENFGWQFLQQVQFYGFMDYGKVWNKGILAAGELASDSLASTGLGARFNILPSLSGGAELAFPMTKYVNANGVGTDGKDPRVFFNLQYRF